MRGLAGRLQEYAGVAGKMGAWGLLVSFWGLWFGVFVHFMLPRLHYLAGPGLIDNDQPCGKPECDFSDFWRAGFTARMPVEKLQHLSLPLQPGALFPLPGGYHEGFPYPPPILLPAAAVSHLPFELGFFTWTLAWLALAMAALRWARLSWPVIVLALLSPAALWNTMLGQMGVAGGALLVAGLLRASERPLSAGCLLGLLVCKPQTGILVPAALLGMRSWRGIAGFATVCAVLILLTFALFGRSVWQEYLGHGRQGGVSLLTAAFSPHTFEGSGVSVFWMLRSLGSGVQLASAIQLAAAALVMGGIAWIWARATMPLLNKAALTVLLSLLATPYGYTDDMVASSIMLAALAERRQWRFGLREAVFWLWPAFCPTVSVASGVLFTPLVVALAALTVWQPTALRARAAVLPPRPTGA
ncbi:MAG TPA: glycosyltransferase family 87 protein [Acidocella sp.]|nr:glycosyltransferase family 87 protein [Acidocella sp.]